MASQEITIPARPDRLYDVLEFIGGAMRGAEISESDQNNINIAVEEIFVNIANYAYPNGEGDITVRLSTEQDQFTVEFKDGGTQYDPLAKPDPDTSLSAEERNIGGLGILIVKKLMDRVEYRYENNTNTLLIQKATR
ncbi:MAG: ATP-binding protein [Clostridiales bacterium]|nr:ATP-binding protein [Clostridiales bacterium]